MALSPFSYCPWSQFPYPSAYLQPPQVPIARQAIPSILTIPPPAVGLGKIWTSNDLLLLKHAMAASWNAINISNLFKSRYSPLDCAQKMAELACQGVERGFTLPTISQPPPNSSVRTPDKCRFVWEDATPGSAVNRTSEEIELDNSDWTQEEQKMLETFFSHYTAGPYIKQLYKLFNNTRSEEFLRDKADRHLLFSPSTNKRTAPNDLDDVSPRAPKTLRLDSCEFFEEKEDALLLELVESKPLEKLDWKKIAQKIRRFKQKAIQERYIRLKKKETFLQTDWTEAEKEKLKQGVAKCKDHWRLISALYFAGERSANDCFSRWRDDVNPVLIKTAWTDEEQNKLTVFLNTRRINAYLVDRVYSHFEKKRSWILLEGKIKEFLGTEL